MYMSLQMLAIFIRLYFGTSKLNVIISAKHSILKKKMRKTLQECRKKQILSTYSLLYEPEDKWIKVIRMQKTILSKEIFI